MGWKELIEMSWYQCCVGGLNLRPLCSPVKSITKMWLKPLLFSFFQLFVDLGRFSTLLLNCLSAFCHHGLCVPCILQLSNSESTQQQLSFLNKQLLLLGEAHKLSTQELQNTSCNNAKVVPVVRFVILFARVTSMSHYLIKLLKKTLPSLFFTHLHGVMVQIPLKQCWDTPATHNILE